MCYFISHYVVSWCVGILLYFRRCFVIHCSGLIYLVLYCFILISIVQLSLMFSFFVSLYVVLDFLLVFILCYVILCCFYIGLFKGIGLYNVYTILCRFVIFLLFSFDLSFFFIILIFHFVLHSFIKCDVVLIC